jgi:hypothetical protein
MPGKMVDRVEKVIEIGATRCLVEKNDGSAIGSQLDLFAGYSTDVWVNGKTAVHARVDPFLFLYSILKQIWCLSGAEGIVIEIGEGLTLSGHIVDHRFIGEIKFSECIAQIDEELSVFVLFLAKTASELASSIARSGADLSRLMAKFPPRLSRTADESSAPISIPRGGTLYT